MKIVFTGPESTGKSIISSWLSTTSGFYLVPEIARPYLESRNIIPQYHDVWEIGLLQYWEEMYAQQHFSDVVCDTDLLTIIIWMEEKFGRCEAFIEERWRNSIADMYMLCRPDIPWEPDPLRENPYDRDRLFDIHKSKLNDAGKPYRIIEGDWSNRKKLVRDYLDLQDK